MQRLQIKTKRDWFIAFVFAFLFTYLVALRYQAGINEFLLPFTPDKISYFNQPDNHGVYAVTVLVMTGLSIGVMIYKKVKGKSIVFALAAGIVITCAIAGSYYYQCHLILKIPSEYKPAGVTVSYYDDQDSSYTDLKLDGKTKEQIVDKVLALKPLSGEEAQIIRDKGDADDRGDELSISIWYPRKHGYSYHIWVGVGIKDSVIRIHKGHSPKTDPIYQDNGLLETLEQIKSDQGIS